MYGDFGTLLAAFYSIFIYHKRHPDVSAPCSITVSWDQIMFWSNKKKIVTQCTQPEWYKVPLKCLNLNQNSCDPNLLLAENWEWRLVIGQPWPCAPPDQFQAELTTVFMVWKVSWSEVRPKREEETIMWSHSGGCLHRMHHWDLKCSMYFTALSLCQGSSPLCVRI